METKYICIQTYMQNNSINSVTGLGGVGKGNGDFSGGVSDTRSRNGVFPDNSNSMNALW